MSIARSSTAIAEDTLLSPKDTAKVSRRVRVVVFLTAWLTTIWFLVGPFIPHLQVWVALTMFPYQLYWSYLMFWVCSWAWTGASQVRSKFGDALAALRHERGGHRSAPSGYVLPEIIHWVVLPNYKEDLDVMRASLNALSAQSIGAHRICIIMAAEKADPDGLTKAMTLSKEFPEFRKFVCNVHHLQPGESPGKSANLASAFRSLCAAVWKTSREKRLENIHASLANDFQHWHEADDERVRDTVPFEKFFQFGIWTCMDADTLFHPFYLWAVEQSFHFEGHASRYYTIWQAPMVNYMNVHRVPNLSRAMCIAVSLHELASLSHPSKMKLPFSTFSVSTKLVFQSGNWAADVIADDWHIFLRAFVATQGRAKVVPIFLPMGCYAVESGGWFASIKARYTQAVRHAWASIETATFFSLWHKTEKGARPPPRGMIAVAWKMFKLHFIGVYQAPLAVAASIVQIVLMTENDYKIWDPPPIADFLRPVDKNFASWFVFLVLQLLISLMPLAAIFSTIAHFKYENVLQEVFKKGYEWCDMRNVERRIRGHLGTVPPADANLPAPSHAAPAPPAQKKAAAGERERLLDVDLDADDADDGPAAIQRAFALADSKTASRLDEVAAESRTLPSAYRVPEIPFATHGKDRTSPLQSSDVVSYCEKFLIPMPPTTWTRIKAIPEAVICVPIAGFIFGFIPELYCQTIQLWRTKFHFTVGAKPTTGTAV
jgi:hypothetical protein